MSASHHRYVALLRAINVGGRSSIRMADLRALFESLDCSGVTTLIQSGNVVFDSPEGNRARLSARIEAALEGTLGYRTDVFLRSIEDLRATVARDPFAASADARQRSSHVMFLSGEPDARSRDALQRLAGDEYEFLVRDRVLYYSYPRFLEGRRRTIDFENVLGIRGTTRTSKVVSRLLELCDERPGRARPTRSRRTDPSRGDAGHA
jgi:uncharacterized protein (DUF1697 family)